MLCRTSQPLLRVVSFGDSMTDNGNGTYLATGRTWPSDPAYDRGRFTNGPVWAEVLADRLGLLIDDRANGGGKLVRGFRLASQKADFLATSDNALVQGLTGQNYTIPVPSLLEQLERYLRRPRDHARTFFTLNIGGNDIFFDPSVDPIKVSRRLVDGVDRLISRGARKVLVAGPGPSLANPSFGPVILSELQRAQSERPDQMIVFDMHQAFIDITTQAAELNITEMKSPCLTGAYNVSESRTLCKDPDTHFFFDDFHPTAYVHRLLGLKAYERVKWFDDSVA